MISGKPYGVRYPWSKWFLRGRFTLRRGRDYECASHGMAQQVRNTAYKRGVTVSLEVGDDHVKVQVGGRRA